MTNSSRLSICLSFNNKFTLTLITAVSKNPSFSVGSI